MRHHQLAIELASKQPTGGFKKKMLEFNVDGVSAQMSSQVWKNHGGNRGTSVDTGLIPAGNVQ